MLFFQWQNVISDYHFIISIILDSNFCTDCFADVIYPSSIEVRFFRIWAFTAFILCEILFCWQVAKSNPEKSIPLTVLKSAKGLAILTVAKAGALVSYKLGTGLVVARRSDGSWSAPSAIFSLGLGWGAQVRRIYASLVNL